MSLAPAWSADAEAMKRWAAVYDAEIWPIVQSRCLKCHGASEPEGELNLARFEKGDQVIQHVSDWERIAKRVRLKEMPPEGSPQLSDPEKGKFHRWLDSVPPDDDCAKIANDETKAWYPGHVMSRRLTRQEYLNAVRDSVGLPVRSELPIPSDGAGGEGFDTNGSSLYTSPIHVEQYLAVASDTLARALADPANGNDKTKNNSEGKNNDNGTNNKGKDSGKKHDVNSETTPQQQASAGERLLGDFVRFIDSPDASISDDERRSAADSVSRFARRSWRRPVPDADVERLMAIYQAARSEGLPPRDALHQTLVAVLMSPHFLFVVETESEAGGVQALAPHQLAFRLSLFLWSSLPDETLLAAADANQLDTPEALRAQVRRMLADPRSRAIGESFGLQWLALANFLSTAKPDAELFPEYDSALASDFREEAIRTVAGVFQEDRSVLELIDSPWVYVNARLADHYQLDKRPGSDSTWQRTPAQASGRGGVITLGATLVSTSYPRRTSPVLRGRWVLEEVLGSRVPPPPPGVPPLEEAAAEKPMSLRERLELHRSKAECASCHNRMDPLGFGLENFDVLARWRTQDDGVEIDASGKLPSGQTFTGANELKQIIKSRSGEFEKHLVRKLLGYALGRPLDQFDDCVIKDCLESLAENDHRATVILETIVTSYPFGHRYFKSANP